MLDAGVYAEADGVTGLDRHGLGAVIAGLVFVASDGGGVDVLDGAVAVEVRSLADVTPVCLGGAGVLKAGEGV